MNNLLKFVKDLHRLRKKKEALQFASASEACFSIRDIIDNLNLRLKHLTDVDSAFKQITSLCDFFNSEFTPLYIEILRWYSDKAAEYNIIPDQKLANKYRVLSPSDFGFHNALKTHDGKNIFLDFEYFGWDDPAKMISDFLLHPAMDLSFALKKRFIKETTSIYAEDKTLLKRVELMYPLYGLKWCLIFLNEYRRSDLQRRDFAKHATIDKEELQNQQLTKSKILMNTVKSTYQNFKNFIKIGDAPSKKSSSSVH